MDSMQAIQEFNNLLRNIQKSSAVEFLGWIRNKIDDMYEKAEDGTRQNSDVIMDTIREDLRSLLPVNATSPTERILTPTTGPNSDCDPTTTVHVDAFLFDDDIIDELCDDGKMRRNFCQQCGSKEISPLIFITHSASVKQIKYVFQHLLPDLGTKTVLDVGSRTGAVLYGAHLFSGASRIVGVELDRNFCELQQKMIEKYGFLDRIQVIHENIMNCAQLLKEADVIILNNVFEFFMDTQAQIEVWQMLYKTVRKPGAVLVTIPSVEESLNNLRTNVNMSRWLKEVDVDAVCKKTNILMYGKEEPQDNELKSIHLYEVLPRTQNQ